jgi:N-acetylglucosamine-6-phosphate deacetylase
MLTEIPARVMKVNKGVIASGKDADIVVFDEDINVTNVFVAGNKQILN